jgi:hypothetical protein
MEPSTGTRPRSSTAPRAAAQMTTRDDADTDLLQTIRMVDGARCFPTETANAPRCLVEPSVRDEAKREE